MASVKKWSRSYWSRAIKCSGELGSSAMRIALRRITSAATVVGRGVG
jgi:hypothetical protein